CPTPSIRHCFPFFYESGKSQKNGKEGCSLEKKEKSMMKIISVLLTISLVGCITYAKANKTNIEVEYTSVQNSQTDNEKKDQK
ncbi:MAG TPA: hypothetical protein PK683_20090, partial [Leptospiraceae bacterium]|nr:hypothetical protein [Leptospiraceae bacterium]